jgi:high-affinity iron transporter
VQAALLTGVLGFPADPRLIEVVGWFAYLIPTMLFLLWPPKRRPTGRALATMRLAIAGTLVAVAAVLVIAVTLPTYSPPSTATISSAVVKMPTSLASATPTIHEGLHANVVTTRQSVATPGRASTLTLDQLVTLNGGRLPIGISAARNPGPFAAAWQTTSTTSVWTYGTGILDAQRNSTTIVTLTGGGLAGARTISPAAAQTDSARMSSADRDAIVSRITAAQTSAAELLLWKLWIPVALLLAALVLVFFVLRSRPRPRSHRPQERVKETYA